MAINFPSTLGQPTDGTFTYQVAGLTYSWNGESWTAAGGGATATDLTVFSVTNASASGGGALAYNNSNGVFTFTPPNLTGLNSDTLQTVTNRGATTSNNITFSDNVELRFGALTGGDLFITHLSSSNNSLIRNRNSSGSFIIDTVTGSPIELRLSSGGEKMGVFNPNGSVELYYDNEKKLETTTEGVTITGSAGNNNLQVDGDALVFGGLTAGGLSYPTSVGTSGQALTSDGAGNVVWGDVATTGLQSRGTVSVTQSINSGSSANISFTTPKTYVLYSIQTSHAAWVTLYMDTTSRTNDASRSETTDPTPGSGVLAEVITSGAVTQWITPGTICFNSASGTTTYAKVVNKSGSTANVQVTLTYLQLEG